jgi:hypothetical protein
MAVKKVGKKAAASKASAKVKPESNVPEVKELTGSKNKKGVFAAILVAFVLFTVVEIFYVARQNAIQNKKPEFVLAWPHSPYNGIAMIRVFGNLLYGTDDVRYQVFQFDKTTGKMQHMFDLPDGALGTVQKTNGDILILNKGNVISVFSKDYKLIKKVVLTDTRSARRIEIDSKDNIYVGDEVGMKVVKYSPDFVKMMEIGASGNNKLTALGKIFVSPKDNLYCMNMKQQGKAAINEYNEKGDLIRSWTIPKVKQITNLCNIGVATDDYIYMNSFEESKVFVFTPAGKFAGTFDTDGARKFVVTYPSSLTSDNQGAIYVLSHELAMFNKIDIK